MVEEEKSKKTELQEETKAEHKVYLTSEAKLSRNSEKKKVLNEFIILETIGHGAFSKVKRIQQLSASGTSGQQFGMKQMHKPTLKRERALAYDKEGNPTMTNNLEKVYNEIELWSSLDHKYIIKLYDIIDDPTSDYLYLVMDLADLGQIANWDKDIEKYKRNEKICSWVLANKLNTVKFENEQAKIEAVAKFIFKGIAESLAYLHNVKNIVHRDIKPDNILFSSIDGCVKITDFTVSKKLRSPTEVCFETEGTAAFTAPECSTVAEGYIPKPTDIWSLGMCLHTFIGEAVPFYAESELEMQLNAQNKDLVLPKEFSPSLGALLVAMLCKVPEKRLNISEVLAHPWFK